MHEVEVVSEPAGLTPDWLTTALRATGRDVTVTDVRSTPVGTGQMGESYRLAFTARGDVEGLPGSVVAKLPAPDPGRRSMAAPGYRSELTFYEHVAPTIAARVPACHLHVASEDWHAFTLLLEDLAPAEQGDQIAGCGVAEAAAAAVNLAGLHGPRWSDPGLWDIPHVTALTPEDVEFFAAVFSDASKTFTERFAATLGPDDLAVLDAVPAALEGFLLGRADRFGVLHGDYRLDNLLFHPDGSSVAAVDFQTMTVGLPGRDLAYLVATSLEPADRRAAERDIVAAYHEALLGHGVEGYDLDTCVEDYRVGMLQAPLIIVLGAAYGSRTERGDAMFSVMTARSLEAMRDLDSLGTVMTSVLDELGFYVLAGQARSTRDALAELADGERLGFGTAFVSERYNKKEAGVLCGAAGAVTERIRIASAATNHNSRHLMVTAGLARTMQSLTGGRFVLGLGRGIAPLQDAYGLSRITTAQMEDVAGVLRRLFRGEAIFGHDGPAGRYPVLHLDSGLDEHLPLAVVAFGPNTLELGGRAFDDVVLHTYFTDETTSRCVATVKAAAERAGRDPASVRVWACLATIPDALPHEDRLLKSVGRLGTYLQGYGDLLARTNDWDRRVVERFLADPVVSSVAGLDIAGTVDQLEHAATLLPDEWLAVAATGSPGSCASAVRHQIDLGCDGVILHGCSPAELEPVLRAYRAAAS